MVSDERKSPVAKPGTPGASAAIAGRSHEMPPRSEVTINHGVRRQEPLCLVGRLEALHLSLSSPGRPV